MHDVIIVGGGPAGLTAALYACRAGLSVRVLEAKSCGGQILKALAVENYPAAPHIAGFDLAERMAEQARAQGAEFVFEKAVGIEARDDGYKTVVTARHRYDARAVILATGSESRKLGLENEDALVGRGVSYCATCDGAFFRNKDVAVVGGGNTALEDALYLSGLAATVTLIHRRDAFRGEEATAARLRERDNVRFVLNSTVTRLLAEKRLTGVEVTDKSGQVRTLAVRGLFVAAGRVPENQAFASLIRLDPAGYAAAGEDCRTNVPGIFVAGDIRAKEVRQLVTATGDGAVAATQAVQFIRSSAGAPTEGQGR